MNAESAFIVASNAVRFPQELMHFSFAFGLDRYEKIQCG